MDVKILFLLLYITWNDLDVGLKAMNKLNQDKSTLMTPSNVAVQRTKFSFKCQNQESKTSTLHLYHFFLTKVKMTIVTESTPANFIHESFHGVKYADFSCMHHWIEPFNSR